MKTSLIAGKNCVKPSKNRRLALLLLSLVLGLSASDAWRGDAAARVRVAAPALTATNGRIAFISERDGNQEIYSMNPDGSDQRRLTDTPTDEADPVWSPDGTRIAFAGGSLWEKDLYVMAADGSGLPTRLTVRVGLDHSSNFHPAWSPDGSKIAFVKDPNLPGTGLHVYVMNADGTNPVKLTETGALNDMPSWSPDGSKIVFRSNRLGSRTDIFVMNADGSAETHLPTPPLSIVEHPSFSPDGSQIVFNGTSVNNVGGIHLMNADGSNLRRIANTNVYDAQPAFSPDGSKIAFLTYGGLNGDIYVTNAEGGARVRIDGNDAFDGLPDWQRVAATSAGDKIAFVSDRDGNQEIYKMNVDGGSQQNLSNTAALNEKAPAWSPNGTRIAFLRDNDNNLYIMNADGTGQVKVTNNDFQHIHITNLSWSPDGSKIAYVAGGDLVHDLYTINADGTNKVKLSEFNSPYLDLVWSPDGRRLAFSVGFSFNQSDINVINADGSGRTRLTNEASLYYSRSPAWSPDSTKIAYETNRDGNDEIYVLSLPSGSSSPVRLTNTPAREVDPTWSPDGTRIAFSSDRDGNFQNFTPGAFEIYTMNASDGGGVQRLTTNAAFDGDPEWQPTGEPGAVAPDTLQFNLSAYRAFEDPSVIGGDIEITVTRLGDRAGTSRVDYTTSDGTATQRTDYTAMSGTLEFAPGQASQSFSIPITLDSFIEGNETASIFLSNAVGAAFGSQNAAQLTISDAYIGAPPPNTIDDARNFVRQQYHDFLNREPDASGLAFWTNQITACGSDAACVARKRVDVSGAFFLSVEFQQTGYLAYRLQLLSFKEFPRYADFLRDTQQMQRGVVVGQGDWQVRLASNQRVFTDEWVARLAFRAIYDSKTNAEYVDTLLSNSGVSFTQEYRNGLVSDLNSGGKTRPEVLRQIAELPSYKAKETNRAMVLMQYFGYLRRNPDDAPDGNFNGYNFWLNKLNQFNGDFRAAEMVKAFITSPEYRHRFGS